MLCLVLCFGLPPAKRRRLRLEPIPTVAGMVGSGQDLVVAQI